MGGSDGYWETRTEMMYYKYIDILVRAFAADARTLLDVGSNDVPLIETFDWIPVRHALDLSRPYESRTVTGIRADFLDYHPDEKYDFVVCLQVLEHIKDVGGFAEHLFEVGRNVLVSVPFRWPSNRTRGHVQDPVDLAKLGRWFGREPSYHVVVGEPLGVVKHERLLAYYHDPKKRFSLRTAREHLRPS